MYLFEESEYVIYKGDGTTLNEPRRTASLAIVNKIDESKFPYVNLKLIPSNELIGVEARLIRTLETSEKWLLKIGFNKSVINKSERYELDDFIVGGVVLFPAPGFAYFGGFRQLPSIPFQVDPNQLMQNGEVKEDVLEQLFPSMHNLNHLVKHLNDTGLSDKTIPEIVEVKPFY